MTYEEFERLIGKRVDYSTFEEYEFMYMGCTLSKQEFVKRLNIEAIPEKASIVAKREELKEEIAEIEQWNAEDQWAIDNLTVSPERMAQKRWDIRERNKDITKLKAQLKALNYVPKFGEC